MRFVRRVVAAALVAPVFLVAACNDDPEPRFEESPSATPTPTSTETAEPEPWEEKSNAGAVAFAEHWMTTFTVAMNAGQGDKVRELSDQRCETCMAIADRIDSIEAEGGYYRSPGWKVLQAVAARDMPTGEAVVALRIRQGKEEFRESAESEVIRNPASKASYSARLVWAEGGWLVTELRLVK